MLFFYFFFFFFFSSRRRHTRSLRDWSSDVCSSDLRQRSPDRLHRSVASPGLGKSCDREAPLQTRIISASHTSPVPIQSEKAMSSLSGCSAALLCRTPR